mmetsp:Transcript_32497/g.56193  ORF Transcript_32497/g.56193 Transcript_32497/m.56193 type:complete len:433 (-) Transcript_32497:237-1535(-)
MPSIKMRAGLARLASLAMGGTFPSQSHYVPTMSRQFSSFITRSFAIETIKLPSMGESITQGAIQSWVKKVGDFVKMDEVVVVVESDKLSQEIRSPFSGVITKTLVDEGADIPVGDPLFVIDTDAKAPAGGAKPAAKPQETPKQEEQKAPKQDQPKSEAAKPETSKAEPARQEPAKEAPRQDAPKAAAPAPAKPAVKLAGTRTERKERMSKMRQRIAERLKGAQNTYAMLTTFQECDMSRAIDLRNTYKDEFAKKHGVKLGFMSFFMKAAAYGLQQVPQANAVIEGNEIIYRDYIDISVAVAAPTGLVVPVVRNVEHMSFADIEKAIANFANKAKTGTLALEDMQGGTFTISNGGVYGSMMGTPIINSPQSAILGMHNIENRAVVREEGIVARPMMYLALTYDHRLLDGKDAVTFLRAIKLAVEEPSRLLLEL